MALTGPQDRVELACGSWVILLPDYKTPTGHTIGSDGTNGPQKLTCDFCQLFLFSRNIPRYSLFPSLSINHAWFSIIYQCLSFKGIVCSINSS